MKVKDLIENLNKVNPELEILLASDEEGNSYCVMDPNGLSAGRFINEDDNKVHDCMVFYPLSSLVLEPLT